MWEIYGSQKIALVELHYLGVLSLTVFRLKL